MDILKNTFLSALILIKIILMHFFSFYREDFPIELFPKNFTYEYNQEDDIKIITLGENDEAYIALKELLIKNKHGWRHTLDSYTHGSRFVSPKMKINCFGNDSIVVNYENKEGIFVQIVKDDTGPCPKAKLGENDKNKSSPEATSARNDRTG